MTDTRTSLEKPGLDERQHRMRRTLESLTGIAFTEGNSLTVLRNGDRIFPAMLAAIDGAEHSVDLMTYVYWKGDIAIRFADALSAAAGRCGSRARRSAACSSTRSAACRSNVAWSTAWTTPACTSSGSASPG